MYCENCGHLADEQSRYCSVCGKSLTGANNEYTNDKPSVLLNAISFIFPPIGLIMYLMYEDRKPTRAKVIEKSASIGWLWCAHVYNAENKLETTAVFSEEELTSLIESVEADFEVAA